MTLTEIENYALTEVKDNSDVARMVIRGGINKGLNPLRAKMKRIFTIETRKFYPTPGQSIYQIPENAIRIASIHHFGGGTRTPVHYVDSTDAWDAMRSNVSQTGIPNGYRMTEADLFEFTTAPDSGTDYFEIKFQSRAKPLSFSDYVTGTVAVTNSSNMIVGTSTAWTANLIGKFFKVTDTQGDGQYYRVISVESNTALTLENAIDMPTLSTVAYLIGEQPNLPQEYHYALGDMGINSFYRWRKDPELAKSYYNDYLLATSAIEDDYSSETVSNVIPSKNAQISNGGTNFGREARVN